MVWLVVTPLLVLVLIFVLWFFSDEREPVYQGRKLSEWAHEVKFLDPDSPPIPSDVPVQAIQTIGTNALPYAIRWLSPDPRDKIKENFGSLVGKFNESQRWMTFDTHLFEPTPKWGWAMAIFYSLGTNARTAIPQLTALLEGSDLDTSTGAAEALSQIGTESIPTLLRALVSTNRQAEEGAIQALMMLGTNSLSAAPVLLDYLRKDFRGLGDVCALAMLRIDPESPSFREAMIYRFEASYPTPSRITYVIVERLGTNAAATAPRLIDIIESDNSPLGNGLAVRALCKVDPIRGELYATKRMAAIEAWQATNQAPPADLFAHYFLRNASTNSLGTSGTNSTKN